MDLLDYWRGTLTPRRVAALVEHLPRESATVRLLYPETAWGDTEELLARVLDQLRVANWQRTKDGSKGRNAPKPTPRPGVQDPSVEVIGSGSWTLEEMRQKLDAWPGRRRDVEEVARGN